MEDIFAKGLGVLTRPGFSEKRSGRKQRTLVRRGCEWRIFVHAVVEFDSAVCVREVLLRLKGTFKAGTPLTLFDSEGATELDLQISKSKYSPKSLPLAQGRRISDF